MVLKQLNTTNENEVLPVVFTGTPSKCQRYAESRGYKARPCSNLFGLYFSNDEGVCLFPDVENSILKTAGQYIA